MIVMGFYKGYVATKDKRATESFKNKAKLKTLKEIRRSFLCKENRRLV